MNNIATIKQLLQNTAHEQGKNNARFFKTGEGEYSAGDKFMGVSVPSMRLLAKDFYHLTLNEITELLASEFNEERFFGLIILVQQYIRLLPSKLRRDEEKAPSKQTLYEFYLANLHRVNNWNLVDASAHLIVGAHLLKADKQKLLDLATSTNMWERRVAIVATWYFIRNNKLEWTFKIAKMLLNDEHDLIHKAVGWMLREAGKKDPIELVTFLDLHAKKMPRTMLRYALEKLPEAQRKAYLKR